jgi:hypothetical protein
MSPRTFLHAAPAAMPNGLLSPGSRNEVFARQLRLRAR